jgi:nucleotide-binding universal stress UspA family protein
VWRTIVAGTDGSDTASLAIEHAVDLAAGVGAELVVVSAYDEAGTAGSFRGSSAGRGASAAAIASALLRDVEGRHGARVVLRTVAAPGPPATALVRQAERDAADLLVVGNRGMAQAQWLRLSVPGKVAQRAPISVLVVDTVGGRRPGYGRILVGAGGGASAAAALELATWLADRIGATLTTAVVGSGGEEVDAARRLREAWPRLDVRSLAGTPAAALCNLAESDGYDLLVVGNRGMTGARRIMGSVPDKVSHRARTNVLIVHTVD